MRYQAHHQDPSRKSVRLAICYKNFGALKGISHIGLGVAARNTAATLRRLGYRVEVWALTNGQELDQKIAQANFEARHDAEHPMSHVVISAPWVPTTVLQQLTMKYPEIIFSVSSHSNVGFLQADLQGMKLLRETFELATGALNFCTAGNSRRYCEWAERAYGVECWFLPNLYDLSNATRHPHRKPLTSGKLRIGCFGATRPTKNFVTAAAAGLETAKRLNIDVEFWISGSRDEGTNGVIRGVILAMYKDVPRARVVENDWQTWPAFRSTVAGMDILFQPSYTESFNMVTADGIAEGIVTVGSSAIDWLPDKWKADVDDAGDIADHAVGLLHDNCAPQDGLRALTDYVTVGISAWKKFLHQRR